MPVVLKNPGNLLSNVFMTDNQPHTAELTFTEEAKKKSSKWSGEPIAELRGIEIYDTALIYKGQTPIFLDN